MNALKLVTQGRKISSSTMDLSDLTQEKKMTLTMITLLIMMMRTSLLTVLGGKGEEKEKPALD